MSGKNDKVRFVRIRGRIVPIRANRAAKKTEKATLSAGQAITSSFVSGGATYAALSRQQKKLGILDDRYRRIIERGSRSLAPFRPKQVNIFEFNYPKYLKQKAAHESIIRKVNKFKGAQATIRNVSKYISKYKTRLALGVGAAAGVASLIVATTEND